MRVFHSNFRMISSRRLYSFICYLCLNFCNIVIDSICFFIENVAAFIFFGAFTKRAAVRKIAVKMCRFFCEKKNNCVPCCASHENSLLLGRDPFITSDSQNVNKPNVFHTYGKKQQPEITLA